MKKVPIQTIFKKLTDKKQCIYVQLYSVSMLPTMAPLVMGTLWLVFLLYVHTVYTILYTGTAYHGPAGDGDPLVGVSVDHVDLLEPVGGQCHSKPPAILNK